MTCDFQTLSGSFAKEPDCWSHSNNYAMPRSHAHKGKQQSSVPDTVAGGGRGVPSVSEYARTNPPKFVRAVLDTVEQLPHKPKTPC